MIKARRRAKPDRMYFNPSDLARVLNISRRSVYNYVDFIKKHTGINERYGKDAYMQRPGMGQRIHILVFLDAYVYKKAVEMGYAPDYDPQEMVPYLLQMGEFD